MTIAGRINLLVAGLALLAGLLLTAFLAQREHVYQRDAIAAKASSVVAGDPQLQLLIYERDHGAAAPVTRELLALSPAIKYVTLYTAVGELIRREYRFWATDEASAAFAELREGLAPLDSGVGTRSSDVLPDALRLFSAVERTTSLTLPIISAVNPMTPDLTRQDFAEALLDVGDARSQHVTGYLELGVSRMVLWRHAIPAVMGSAGAGFVAILVGALLARLTLRSVTAPLHRLSRIADEIAKGKRSRPIELRGSDELREITQALNGIIGGLQQHQTQLDADRKMHDRQFTEHSQELEKRREALDAEQRKIDATRDQVRRMTYFDSLTELPNRRLFTEQLTLLLRLAVRHGHKVALVVIDVDHFKRINESLGASGGDKLLRVISERLRSGVRDSDVLHRSKTLGKFQDGSEIDLSRLGGDEFTVVLNQVENISAALTVAERLAESINEPTQIDGQEVVVTASLGVAVAPDQATDVEGLLRAAGAAMITAKKKGRHSVLAYDDSMQGSNRERLQLETDLRKAIERDQLLLHYQPQVHSGTGEVVGAEALVRWKHPQRGLVPPFVWIPMAEEIGIIDAVGDWVLEEACCMLREVRQSGLTLPKVSVNVSALQFTEDFVERVLEVLGKHKLSNDSLELELTEGIMINDDERIVELVRRLKDEGVRLSIDDFGTGYSSLSYLSRFPLDELKIDRSFVLGLRQGTRETELVRAIIALGRGLGLDIVVEGVETPEELAFFRSELAEVIQGYLFSTPVSQESLTELLEPAHFRSLLDRLESGV